jgi:hypothetical protein
VPTGEDKVRQAIAGADRAFALIDGGKGKKPPEPPADDADRACPVHALGHIDGRLVFTDCIGQKRELTAKQLGSRHDLLNLFGHDDSWLRAHFPKKQTVPVLDEAGKPRRDDNGQILTQDVTVDFTINAAANYLGSQCFAAGMFGKHMRVRRPGVWPHGQTDLAVHCGDVVRVGAGWQKAGFRDGNMIWAAAPPEPRPDTPCDASVGRALQQNLQSLFRFAAEGGAIAVIGVLGTAYLGAAAHWRPSAFIFGPGGCGKSALMQVLVACCPLNLYKNDASKAGIEGDVSGIAMPVFIDENDEARDKRLAESVMNMVLTASGGTGTQGTRGSPDGKSRAIEIASSFFFAATHHPEMKDTHLGRVVLIKLRAPEDGADHTVAHEKLAEGMRRSGPKLWSRALSSFERYGASLAAFRDQLGRIGCKPREMDQFGAILAGWWILTEEGVPNVLDARAGVAGLDKLVRTADMVAEEGSARRLVQFLLSTALQMDRSTDREPVASLMDICLHAGETDAEMERRIGRDGAARVANIGADRARRVLAAHGIKTVSTAEAMQAARTAARAAGDSDLVADQAMPAGVWFANSNKELKALFNGSEWEGMRWHAGLLELPSSRTSGKTMKIGALPTRAIWVSAADLGLEEKPMPASEFEKPPW